VAGVVNWRVTTVLTTTAFIVTFGRASSAWLWWVEAGTATGAADFMKDCFEAAPARSFVAEVGTVMVSTLKRLSAFPCAKVLGFDFIEHLRGVQRPMLAL
jgi:hypothetical protein